MQKSYYFVLDFQFHTQVEYGAGSLISIVAMSKMTKTMTTARLIKMQKHDTKFEIMRLQDVQTNGIISVIHANPSVCTKWLYYNDILNVNTGR